MEANQKGLSVVEILIVIVNVGLIGAAGWLVYSHQTSKIDSNESATQTSQQQQKFYTQQEAKSA
jgi:Tfp pilus assembly protein PilV